MNKKYQFLQLLDNIKDKTSYIEADIAIKAKYIGVNQRNYNSKRNLLKFVKKEG